jgi:PAS domain S-box-containing protein
MKRVSTLVTVFALVVPAAALLAAHPVLASVDRSPIIGSSLGSTAVVGGAVLIAVGACVWAGATILALRTRHRHHEREQLHDLLRRFDAAIILTDRRGTITTMNGAAATMTGWDEAAVVGLPVGAVFQLVDPQTHRRVVNPVVKALYKDTVVGPSQGAVLLTRDGEERHIVDTSLPIRDGRGRVVGCALVGCDLGDPPMRGRRIEIQETRH